MTTRRCGMILWLTTALLTAAAAAPLPILWPWAGLQAVGWRYDREFTTWPGPYWRGVEQPPLEADPTNPATWGSLRCGDRLQSPPAPLTGVADVVVPLTDEAPLLNGLIGYEEWSQALPVLLTPGEGQQVFLLLQRTDTTLYVCLACSSLTAARGGQVAELYLDTGHRTTSDLGPQQWQVKGTLTGPTQAVLTVLDGRGGHWQARPLGKSSAWRLGAGSGGDGAWSYPVFEFALPLSELSDKGTLPERFGFMARLQTFGRGKPLPMPGTPTVEAVYWPDGRSAYGINQRTPLGLRPDGWGHLRVAANDPQPGPAVPLAAGPVTVDGQLGLREWKAAARQEYRFPGDQYRLLYVQRDKEHVYVAVRTRTARGLKAGEYCGLYLDPNGDGGLRPRSDDVLYKQPLGCEIRPTELHFAEDSWQTRDKCRFTAASYPLSTYESSYEFALPVSLFDQPQAPNLAVEVSYEVPR